MKTKRELTDQELITELQNSNLLTVSIDGYRHIRDTFNTYYEYPELSSLKRLVERSIIKGEFLGAMLLTNFLMEYFCKIVLIYHYTFSNKDEVDMKNRPFQITEELQEPTDIYDEKNLHNNIEKLKKLNLIDEINFEKLMILKEKFRNSLNHANRKKLYEESVSHIEAISVENKNLVSLGQKFEKNYLLPLADFKLLENFSIANCVDYFLELDLIIKSVLKKLSEKHKK
ncbi:MAG TPA: hypothetical protein PLG90_08820 [Ignavibacteria bacterium]|nr:hypothetical protein [Ignavibacteria bacterium]